MNEVPNAFRCQVSWGDGDLHWPVCDRIATVRMKDDDGSSFFVCARHRAYVATIPSTWKVVEVMDGSPCETSSPD